MHIYAHTHTQASISEILGVEKHEVYTAGLSLAPLTYFENLNAASASLSVCLWICATAARLHLSLSLSKHIQTDLLYKHVVTSVHPHSHWQVAQEPLCHVVILLCSFLSDKQYTTVILSSTKPKMGNVEGKTTTSPQSQLILAPYERKNEFCMMQQHLTAKTGEGVGVETCSFCKRKKKGVLAKTEDEL